MATRKRAVSNTASRVRAKGRKAAARPQAPRRPEEVERWIQAEVRAQERIYRRIVREMNALNDALMDQLGDALLAFDADDAVGCIVVTGNERAFAAGADISAIAKLTFAEGHQRNPVSYTHLTLPTSDLV